MKKPAQKTLMRKILIAVLLAVAVVARAQGVHSSAGFVINPDRPFIYLEFDHVGKGIQRNEDEPAMRLWFKFVNNCDVAVKLRTYGAPQGSPPNEVGVMDDVVPDKPILKITLQPPEEVTLPPLPDSTKQTRVDKTFEKMPHSYSWDVFSLTRVPPGQAVLFSLPINHVGKSWHIEIPFEFDTPTGRGPRTQAVGGEPVMYLNYSLYDLPDAVRTRIMLPSHD